MDGPTSPAMTGVLRVIFAAALAAVLIAFLVGLVTSVYEEPESHTSNSTFSGSNETAAHNRYERNIGIILSLSGIGFIAGSILGLRSSLNPLRCGGLAGGLVVFLVGAGFSAAGANDWLGPILGFLALVILIVSSRRLADGWPGVAIGLD